MEAHYTALLLHGPVFDMTDCKSAMNLVNGIAYDRRYILRQYGHKQNQNTQLHTITLLLERVKGQRSIEELASVPTPSQMDNWALFEKHEGDLVKKVHGVEDFREWRVKKAQEKVERVCRIDLLVELAKGINLAKPSSAGING